MDGLCLGMFGTLCQGPRTSALACGGSALGRASWQGGPKWAVESLGHEPVLGRIVAGNDIGLLLHNAMQSCAVSAQTDMGSGHKSQASPTIGPAFTHTYNNIDVYIYICTYLHICRVRSLFVLGWFNFIQCHNALRALLAFSS